VGSDPGGAPAAHMPFGSIVIDVGFHFRYLFVLRVFCRWVLLCRFFGAGRSPSRYILIAIAVAWRCGNPSFRSFEIFLEILALVAADLAILHLLYCVLNNPDHLA
jgi:hypothetical protein